MFNIGDKVKYQTNTDCGRIYRVADVSNINHIQQIKIWYKNNPYWCDSSCYDLVSPKATFKVGDKLSWRSYNAPYYLVTEVEFRGAVQQEWIKVENVQDKPIKCGWWQVNSDWSFAPQVEQKVKKETKKMSNRENYKVGDEIWIKATVKYVGNFQGLDAHVAGNTGDATDVTVNNVAEGIVKHIPRTLKMKVGSVVRNDRNWQGWSNTATVVWLDDKEALVSWSDSGGKQLKKRSELVVVSE